MYKALYRKYRPKTFNEVLGQEHITTTLKNQIKHDNIGHAYLFSGTRGTGKTSAAKILSRAVNCLDPHDGEPCNQCRNCIEILKETTVDVIEMDAASNNKVEDIRELREKVIYPPTNIKKKVYIVDEVHMLSNSAFNALLKTLEEPPQHLIFILATTEPEKIPQTILSRCQRFDFKRIQTSDISKNMRKIVKDLGIEVDGEVLDLIARNSDGAMRDALSLLDQCISFSDKKIGYEDALNLLGIANKDILFALVNSIKEKRLEDALIDLDKVNESGKDMNMFLKDLINHFRNLMIIKSSKNPENIIDIANLEAYKNQAQDLSVEFILKALNILIEAEDKSRWSGEIRLILEMSIIDMSDIRDELSLLERIKRLEEGFVPVKEEKQPEEDISRETDLEHKAEDREKPLRKTLDKDVKDKEDKEARDNESAFIDLDLKTITNHWDVVLREIKAKKISLYALIIEGKLKNFSNNQLEVNYDEGFNFHYGAINKDENKLLLEEIISNYFKIDIKVSFSLGNIKTVKTKQEKTDEDAIKEVVDFFGEDIVDIN